MANHGSTLSAGIDSKAKSIFYRGVRFQLAIHGGVAVLIT